MADLFAPAETITKGIAGLCNGDSAKRDSRTAEAIMQYGALAVQGTADYQCKLPTSAAEVLKAVGLVEYNAMREPGSVGYPVAEPTQLVTSGDMWVATEGTVAAGGRCFFRHTASGGNTTLGKARADSDTNTAAETVSPTIFLDSCTGAGLVRVRFTLP